MNDSEKLLVYLNSASKGDADSQYYAALMYENGVGASADRSKAFEWYKKAAEQGHVKAQCNLGNCYEKGIGVMRDLSEAIKWYTAAADNGDAVAQCNLGYCYLCTCEFDQWSSSYCFDSVIKADFNKAFDLFKEAAAKELPRAKYLLGHCYLNGRGTDKNVELGLEWLVKAAKENYPDAFYEISNIFSTGKYFPQDYNKAAVWCKKAADLGVADAGFDIKDFYEGTPGETIYTIMSDRDKWYFYKEIAEMYKNKNDYYECYESGMGVKKDKKAALEWRIKAAEAGNYEAQEKLAEYYSQKIFGKDNEKNAFRMYKLLAENDAAGHNNYRYKYEVAWRYYIGKGTVEDMNKAFKWFNAAYDNGKGIERAINMIAEFYLNGLGTNKAPEKAYELLKKGYDNGLRSYDLVTKLSELYEKGIGTEQNIDKAAEVLAQFHLSLSSEKKSNWENMLKIQNKLFDLSKKNNSFASWYLGKCVENCLFIVEDISDVNKKYSFSDDDYKRKFFLEEAVSKEPVYPDVYADYASCFADDLSNKYEEYLAKAEEAGSPKALYKLGQRADGKTAFGYYALGAQNGSSDCLVEVALCYLKGSGVDASDVEEALAILNGLCEEKNQNALCTLARIYIDGTYVEKDFDKADKLIKTAERAYPDVKSVYDYYIQFSKVKKTREYLESAKRAENGDAEAIIAYAKKIEGDPEKKKSYIRKAIDLGNTDALLEYAKAIKDDSEDAHKEKIDYIQKAINLGNVDAMIEMAEMETDEEKAFKLRNEAIKKGTKNYKAYLGLANYYWGKDIEKARYYARKSREIINNDLSIAITDAAIADAAIAMILNEI